MAIEPTKTISSLYGKAAESDRERERTKARLPPRIHQFGLVGSPGFLGRVTIVAACSRGKSLLPELAYVTLLQEPGHPHPSTETNGITSAMR